MVVVKWVLYRQPWKVITIKRADRFNNTSFTHQILPQSFHNRSLTDVIELLRIWWFRPTACKQLCHLSWTNSTKWVTVMEDACQMLTAAMRSSTCYRILWQHDTPRTPILIPVKTQTFPKSGTMKHAATLISHWKTSVAVLPSPKRQTKCWRRCRKGLPLPASRLRRFRGSGRLLEAAIRRRLQPQLEGITIMIAPTPSSMARFTTTPHHHHHLNPICRPRSSEPSPPSITFTMRASLI